MIRTLIRRPLCSLGLAALAIAAPVAAPPPPAVYTAAQADAGQAVYLAECARCHGRAMQGGVEEPPVAGARFLAKWRERSTHDLLNFIQTRMPPQNPGGLGETLNLQIVAHLLRSSGALSGSEPFSSTTDVTIGSLMPAPPADAVTPEVM